LKIKRKIEVAVISDVHLGTHGCHAKDVLTYLNSIEPKKLVLNGDIIDIWQFNKRYFPKSHLKVIKKIMTMASRGVEVIYITGNHDDLLIVLNRLINWFNKKRGKERFSLSKKMKNGVKGTVKHIHDFEKVVSELAIKNHYDYVVCGHIHQPKMEYFENKHGKTMYLNSGDWVENFTALEYQFKRWKIYNEVKALIAAITIV